MTENAYTTVKSEKSDVYSYGVLLLELLTRKQALDSSFSDNEDIVGWVNSVWERTKDVAVIVDADLANEILDSNVWKQVNQMLLVALRCTEKDQLVRPTMRDVVNQLNTVAMSLDGDAPNAK